ncbi:hypothetical protein MKW94_006477 [Papaver nudicaule]|uniref:FHA domain-containing protein n=1 Tax=Papaver nudicaule TaxID=74823 RepID=A0AA41RKZ1_PAPNU|nr:hypothetical protein [Papaver nudicaule]
MEGSTLRLTVEKGPKEGETVDCKAGSSSVIKIGRVMKGNTLGIRDSGISSNHLVIEFKTSKWVVSDLGSSNGTFLNDNQITPFTDFDLRNEDIIKIGERTSLKVVIIIEEIRVFTKPPTRNGRKNVEVVVDLEEEEEQVRRNPRRRAAPKNFGVAPVSSVPAASAVVENRPKRGRPKKVAYDEAEEILKVPQAPEPKVPPISESEKEIGVEKPENAVLGEPKKTRGGGTRRGRGRKEETVVLVSTSEKVEVSENVAAEPVNCTVEVTNVIVGQNNRVTVDEEKQTLDDTCEMQKNLQSLSIDQNLELEKCEEEEKVAPVVRKKRTAARRAAQKKGKDTEDVRIPDPEEDTSNPKESILQEEEIRHEFASTSDGGVKENLVEENKVDFEKMTLGEWFDYMEVYLPKQLRKTTEEVVSSMRERSRQFSEFMAEQQQQQQKDGKGKHPYV